MPTTVPLTVWDRLMLSADLTSEAGRAAAAAYDRAHPAPAGMLALRRRQAMEACRLARWTRLDYAPRLPAALARRCSALIERSRRDALVAVAAYQAQKAADTAARSTALAQLQLHRALFEQAA